MYKRLLPVLFILGSAASYAQPTLTYLNVGPVLNDTFISVACNTTGVSQGAQGTGVTWNFGTLTASTTLTPNQDTGSVVAVSGAPGESYLSTAALLLGSTAFSTSTYATVTPSGVATYYHEDASTLSQTAVYVSTSSSSLYTTPLVQLEYPFTYSNSFNGTYAGVLSYLVGTSVDTFYEAGFDTVVADAYGTLTLPGYPVPSVTATYTGVLRVHSTLTYTDSADLFGTPVVGTYLLNSYTWYMPGYHAPLLTVSTATGPGVNTSTVSYAAKQTANHEAVPTVKDLSSTVNIYPNPASNYVYISYDNATSQKVRTSIVDVTGREVALVADESTQGITNVNYNVSSLAKGIYLIKLQSATESVTKKLEIQ